MFLDTNVLVNGRILEAPDHDTAREELELAFRDAEPLRINRQVLREYLAVVTRRNRGRSVLPVKRLWQTWNGSPTHSRSLRTDRR